MNKTDHSFRQAGVSGRNIWLLSESHPNECLATSIQYPDTPNAQPSRAKPVAWGAITPSFLQNALQGRNLLPNSDFGGSGPATLNHWKPEAQPPAKVGVDLNDELHPKDIHALYLAGAAQASRPALKLAEPLPFLSEHDLTYQISGFFATHRCDASVEIEWFDQDENPVSIQVLPIEQDDVRRGGRALSNYRWLHWTFTAPASSERANIRLCLGAHKGPKDASSFLFATRLFCGVIDPTKPILWAPTSDGARVLIDHLHSDQWHSAALIEPPATLLSDSLATVTEGDYSVQVRLESASDPAPPEDADAIADILPPSDRRVGWVALHWPLSKAVSIRTDGADSPVVIEPGPLRSRESLLAMLLPGENLLPNAGFDDKLAHWAFPKGCGVDFSPGTCLTDGHVAYIWRKAKQESEPTRLYSDPVLLPASRTLRRYWLSGYLAYHRCVGHLGVEWLDAAGASLDRVQLEPKRPTVRGGLRLENYDQQSAFLDAPADAVAARIFLEKSLTLPGENGSFLFFTRLFFGHTTEAPAAWKPRDAEHLDRLLPFAASADWFLPRIQGFWAQAEAASQAGDWERAAQVWHAILNVGVTRPATIKAHLHLAEALRQQGAVAEADATLNAGIEHFPDAHQLLVAMAEAAMAREDWAAACEWWQRLIEHSQDEQPCSELYLRYSTALCQQQRYQEAEQLIAARMAQDRDNLLLAIAYAEIAMAQQQWTEAMKRWRGLSQ